MSPGQSASGLSPASCAIAYPNVDALVRAVRRRDQRDAARAERLGRGALLVTVITWNDIPPGFVPPKESTSWKRR